MNTIFRAALTGAASLAVAATAAVTMSAPAQAAVVSSATAQQVVAQLSAADSLYLQRDPSYIVTLCNGIVASSQAFDWDGPVGGLDVGARCSDAVHKCVDSVVINEIDDIVTVTLTNYAGPMGWAPWSTGCGYSTTV